jgi:glutamate synthase (NADPH/NADH) small chain
MGKPTGFLEYRRKTASEQAPLARIQSFEPFHEPMSAALLKEQSARCMSCGTPFCHNGVVWNGVVSGCPLGNLIPEWNDLVYKGLYREAWMRLKLTTPFPEFTSRVCPALCEGACACGEGGEPVTVREIERFLSDMAFEKGWEKPRPPKTRTGKKAAVVGSGPAGLACAWRLNHMGHDVTVYEKSEAPGGLLMFGIPNMKLPKSVVKRRIALMEQEGVKFACNADIGKDETAKGLDDAAVALCCGAEIPRDLKIPGRELEGIRFAVPYLAEATRLMLSGRAGERPLFGKCVAVIGGGDTGNDCVATAIRQGAMKVLQLEILPPAPLERDGSCPWPRWPTLFKNDYGQEEAEAVWGEDPRAFCAQTTAFLGADGHVKALNMSKVVWVEKGGRRMPEPIPGTEKTYHADLVLIAMGFTGADDYVYKALGGRRNPEDGVFTCGDMRTGQSLVVKAMADGLSVAEKMDEYLNM